MRKSTTTAILLLAALLLLGGALPRKQAGSRLYLTAQGPVCVDKPLQVALRLEKRGAARMEVYGLQLNLLLDRETWELVPDSIRIPTMEEGGTQQPLVAVSVVHDGLYVNQYRMKPMVLESGVVLMEFRLVPRRTGMLRLPCANGELLDGDARRLPLTCEDLVVTAESPWQLVQGEAYGPLQPGTALAIRYGEPGQRLSLEGYGSMVWNPVWGGYGILVEEGETSHHLESLLRQNGEGACLLPGDVNGDGQVDAIDTSPITAWLLGEKELSYRLTPEQRMAMDATGDQRVDREDIQWILEAALLAGE